MSSKKRKRTTEAVGVKQSPRHHAVSTPAAAAVVPAVPVSSKRTYSHIIRWNTATTGDSTSCLTGVDKVITGLVTSSSYPDLAITYHVPIRDVVTDSTDFPLPLVDELEKYCTDDQDGIWPSAEVQCVAPSSSIHALNDWNWSLICYVCSSHNTDPLWKRSTRAADIIRHLPLGPQVGVARLRMDHHWFEKEDIPGDQTVHEWLDHAADLSSSARDVGLFSTRTFLRCRAPVPWKETALALQLIEQYQHVPLVPYSDRSSDPLYELEIQDGRLESTGSLDDLLIRKVFAKNSASRNMSQSQSIMTPDLFYESIETTIQECSAWFVPRPVAALEQAQLAEMLAKVFDLPEDCQDLLIRGLTNRDHLWIPTETKSYNRLNYFQLLECETVERDPIDSILGYLFRGCDPNYGEKYEYSKEEQTMRQHYFRHLRTKYGCSPLDDSISRGASHLFRARLDLLLGLGAGISI
jgi:hypothetical protein